jgi:hypothetical protein
MNNLVSAFPQFLCLLYREMSADTDLGGARGLVNVYLVNWLARCIFESAPDGVNEYDYFLDTR